MGPRSIVIAIILFFMLLLNLFIWNNVNSHKNTHVKPNKVKHSAPIQVAPGVDYTESEFFLIHDL